MESVDAIGDGGPTELFAETPVASILWHLLRPHKDTVRVLSHMMLRLLHFLV